MHHPDFVQLEWLKVKNACDAQRQALVDKRIIGCEIDSEVARLCRANLKAAGVLEAVELFRIDFADYTPTIAPEMLISNPPHGNRMQGTEQLRPIYRQLGDFMKRKLAKPARGYLFIGNLELTKEVGLAAKRRHVLPYGGREQEARLLEFEIY